MQQRRAREAVAPLAVHSFAVLLKVKRVEDRRERSFAQDR